MSNCSSTLVMNVMCRGNCSIATLSQVRPHIFGPGRRVPKSYSSCSCSCRYQFSEKVFLTLSGAQRNFAYTFVLTLPTDLPSLIFTFFSLMSNYQSSFHVIDLKLDNEPSLLHCRAVRVAQRPAAACTTMRGGA